MSNTKKYIYTLLSIAIAMFTIHTVSASANQRFLPSGINAKSASKAKSEVLDYASLNDDYAKLIATETGAKEFDRKDYKSKGYSKAKPDTNNTSLTSGGSIAESSGAVGTKTLVLINIKTGREIEIMVRCANPRTGGKCHCKPVKVRKVNKILVNKKFKKTLKHTCPSGQVVRVVVDGRVYGWVKGTITAKVIGSAKIYLKQQVQLKVEAQISVACDEFTAPTPPAPPVTPPTTPPTPEVPGPKVYIEGSPAHLYPGGSHVVHFRVTKGAKLDVFGDGQAYVAGFRQVSITWNNQACPADNDCFAVTVWARQEIGDGYVYALATLNGKEDMAAFQFPVVREDF